MASAHIVDTSISSAGLTLTARLVRSARLHQQRHVLVFCHGMPRRAGVEEESSYDGLVARICDDIGFSVLAVNLRGCGTSAGQFSLAGWLDDLDAAVDHAHRWLDAEGVWLAGAATGGTIALLAGARNPAVLGVVAMAARADFHDWAAQPRRLLEHCRRVGVISDPSFPSNVDRWAAELRVDPLDAARRLGNRPVLLLHGDRDDRVPVDDARRLAVAHGAADLRIVQGADHRLRHDPRAVALLLGWLAREHLGRSVS